MADANLQIALKSKFLNLPIDAVYHGTENEQILILYGENKKRESFTISELIGALAKTITLGNVNEETFGNLLPGNIGAEVKFYIDYVYCVKKKSKDKQLTDDEDESTEYAIKISVEPGKLMEGFIIEVSEITFMLWSTDKPKILNEMGISDTQELLALAGNETA